MQPDQVRVFLQQFLLVHMLMMMFVYGASNAQLLPSPCRA